MMKRVFSSIIAFAISFCLFFSCAYAEGEEGPAEETGNTAEAAEEEQLVADITLQYDDRWSFPDAKSITVENGDPAIEVSGKSIRAAGITESPVKVVVDGEEYLVSVEKAVIDIFVIDGQSNASGDSGRHDKSPVTPKKGCGYFWSSGELKDASEYVKALEKKSPRVSVGVWPALSAEWYALTGEKAVVMNISQNGRPIQHWTSGYQLTGAQLIQDCIDSIDTERFTIAGGGYFWFQGESNTDIYEITEQMRYTNTEEYIAEFSTVHETYTAAFASRGIEAFAGIFTIRNWGNLLGVSKTNEYCGPRAALQYLANSRDDIFMVSSIAAGWDKSSKKAFSFTSEAGTTIKVDTVRALFAGVHYNQSGYDILGLEAADSLYSGWRCGDQAADFVLYGQDASTVYEENSVIYLDDNLRITGVANQGERFSAQLVAVTSPKGSACSGLTMSLTRDSDGSEVTGAMTDSGYIPDVAAIDEDMTLTVTLGELSRTYTISKHPHKLIKGAESKKGSFELTDRNGDPIDSAGLGDTVYIRSRAEEGCTPNGISVYETVSGKSITYTDEGMSDGVAVFSFRMPAVDVSVKGKYVQPGKDNIGYRFVIAFDKNAEGATGNMKKMSGSIGRNSIIALNKFEYEGHRFVGWNTAPDGSGTPVEDGSYISEFVIQNHSSIVLYAQWEELPAAEETYVNTEEVPKASVTEEP